ncbi:octanoyl-[acyl-carrier-protein]:protein N-octanoyltransferase LIPT2, mitochondrial isoform X2 [Archocentrus centrarchus]|uniref:octanoyl-[acyl-carrier-protein]:protein N-octanoyltransferase LIPT2, mitochondrial isoform X2 n=1 Tax=Archocentrus centrarchus TaxID=63155 RepID=UPI0011EA23AA|nr:putative lipoyltransferase 2, mitochondrial isoform X2 [Archocentrus centrarchus]
MQGGRPVVEVVRLGLVSYQKALRLQQVYVNRHQSGPAHTLLLCEHPPVYTTGIRHKPYPEPLLDRLRLLGADVHRANRGGLITFHGPGQLVCYPVLNLGSFKKSVRWYVSQLEQTVIALCNRFAIDATTSPHTGVWVRDKKICAIGSHIVPCGIEGKGVTSLSAELQRHVSVEETIPHLLHAFTEQFSCQLTEAAQDRG